MKPKKLNDKKAASDKYSLQEKPLKNKKLLGKAEIRQAEPRPNILWAAVLMLSGFIFLLNNFGLLPWSIWGFLWRFWPVFLIFGGLQVIFGKSPYRKVVVTQLGLTFLIFIFILGLALKVPVFGKWFSSQFPGVQLENIVRFQDASISKEAVIEENKFQNVKARKLNFRLAGGEMKVVDSANSYYLKLNSVYYGGLGEPVLSSSVSQGILNINFETGRDIRLPVGSLTQLKYEFDLGQPIVNSDVNIEIGAGRAAINLERMTLNKLAMQMGAGTADLAIKGNAIPSEGLDVKVGAGSVYIQIPKNVSVKITHSVGLGTLRFNQTNVSGKGVFQPTSFEPVNRVLEMKVDVGAGTVNIETN